ncbi:binary toxin-like calcium binding domain-containing protein [Enterococcus faecalis]|uniref:binary toxin-like calcium binding domain-containing protein n=1 Tax=Enterococcus faecalis TaxID=1351 RepID=UPI0035E5CDA2
MRIAVIPIILFMVGACLFCKEIQVQAVKIDNDKNVVIMQEEKRNGLHGEFYKNSDFSELLILGKTDMGILGVDTETFELIGSYETIHSVIWQGYIKPKETHHGNLTIPNIKNTIISINDTVLVDNQVITLKKDERAIIRIESVITEGIALNEIGKLNLEIKKETGSYIFSNEEFYLPEYQETIWKEKFNHKDNIGMHSINVEDDSVDTDNDSIPDEWEINGYTIQNKKAVKWKDSFLEKGYVKYVSNPLEAHTAGDPYTDLQKAANDIPAANAKSTRNPLVAAYPSVSTTLEKLILSPNEDLSHSVSNSNHSDYTYSNTINLGGSGGMDATGPKFDISGSYSHSESTTTGWSNTRDDTTHLNAAEAAYLNANVRYRNTGTGAIYDVQPTTSFVLGDSTIGTITSKTNTTALSMESGGTYPKNNQNGIAINTMDDFDSRPIPLNKNQKEMFMSGKSTMDLQTDQTDGHYAMKTESGAIVKGDQWSTVTSEIENRTAAIMLNVGEGIEHFSEVRVVGKNYNDPEDKNPEVTLGEALQLAYPEKISVDKKDGMYYFLGKPISEGAINFYTDENTAKMIEKQLLDRTGSFKDVQFMFQLKLEPRMNLTLNVADFYESFENQSKPFLLQGGTFDKLNENLVGPSSQSMSGFRAMHIEGKQLLPGTISPKGQKLLFSEEFLKQVEPEAIYKISYYRRGILGAPSNAYNIVSTIEEIDGVTSYGHVHQFLTPKDNFTIFNKQSISVRMKTTGYDSNEYIKGLFIQEGYIDDITIAKVGK